MTDGLKTNVYTDTAPVNIDVKGNLSGAAYPSKILTDWVPISPTPITGLPIAATGVKFDKGKVRYDLIPPEALEEWAKVLTFGAQKYADRNWEKGMKWGRVFGAMMRHGWAWWRGESKDSETGLSHLGHLMCCASFLLTYEKRKIGEDDRSATTS